MWKVKLLSPYICLIEQGYRYSIVVHNNIDKSVIEIEAGIRKSYANDTIDIEVVDLDNDKVTYQTNYEDGTVIKIPTTRNVEVNIALKNEDLKFCTFHRFAIAFHEDGTVESVEGD